MTLLTPTRRSAANESELCRRVSTVPSVGPIVSTAIVAPVGNARAFRWVEVSGSIAAIPTFLVGCFDQLPAITVPDLLRALGSFAVACSYRLRLIYRVGAPRRRLSEATQPPDRGPSPGAGSCGGRLAGRDPPRTVPDWWDLPIACGSIANRLLKCRVRVHGARSPTDRRWFECRGLSG